MGNGENRDAGYSPIENVIDLDAKRASRRYTTPRQLAKRSFDVFYLPDDHHQSVETQPHAEQIVELAADNYIAMLDRESPEYAQHLAAMAHKRAELGDSVDKLILQAKLYATHVNTLLEEFQMQPSPYLNFDDIS